VHVLIDGRIVAEGDADLARRVEAEGFDAFRVGALQGDAQKEVAT
jgi:Fe-S cluster assembly ATPase SufC